MLNAITTRLTTLRSGMIDVARRALSRPTAGRVRTLCMAGLAAAGALAAPAAWAQDVTAPRVSSIARQTPASSPTNADSVTWRVTFDEAVSYTPDGPATPFAIANVANVSDAGALELYRAQVSTTAVVNGTTYLFVGSPNDEGVSVFSVANDGTLTNVENVADDATLFVGGISSLDTALVNGTVYLFVGGGQEDGISVFSVANNGSLTSVDNVADDGTLFLNETYAVTTAEVNGTTYLFAGGNDLGVSVFSVANNGTLTSVDNVADDATLNLAFYRSMTTAVVNGTTYLFVASITDDGVSVFSVANNGTLTNVANVSDDATLEILDPYAVATAVVNSTTYLFVAGYADDGIGVFSVADNGTLTSVDNVTDSGALELDAVRSLAAIDVNGTTYLFAVGFSDNGFSAFSVADNGTLTNVENVADDGTLNIAFPTTATTATVNGTSFLFVTGFLDDGVSGFSLTPAAGPVSNFALAGTTASASVNTVSATVVDVTASGGDLAGLSGTATLSFGAGQTFTDLAGNALTNTTPTGANDNTFQFDNSGPVLQSLYRQTPSTSPTSADSVTWRIDFNEPVANVDAGDFSVAGTTATLSVILPAANIVDVTASGGNLASLNGDVTLSVSAGNNITDTGGNALTNLTGTSEHTPTFTMDNAAPRIASITRLNPAGSETNADSVSWRVTFNEAVANLSADDFDLTQTTGSLSASNITATTVDLTASGGDMANGAFGAVIALAAGHNITDAGGTPLTSSSVLGTNDNFFNLDNTPPNVDIIHTDDTATSAAPLVVWDISFFENHTGLLISHFDVVTTGTVNVSDLQIVQDNGTSVQVSANLTGDGTAQLTLLPNAPLVDAVGNGNGVNGFTSAYTNTQFSVATVDNTAPRIASIERFSPGTERASNDTVRWRVTFSETVSNVTADDFTVAGTTGTLSVSNLTTTTVDLDLSGGDMAALDGTVTLSVAGGQNITDAAGNAMTNTAPTGTNDNSFIMDNTPPRVASVERQSSTGVHTNADSITWRVTFNEDVSSIDATKFGLTVPAGVDGSTISLTVTQVSATIYDVTASGGDLAGMNGDVTLRIFTTVDDVAFNTMTDATPTGTSELTYSIDNSPLDISGIYRVTPAGEKTNADTLVWIAAADLSSATEAGIDAATVSAGDFALTGPTGATLSVSVDNNFNDGSARITVTASGGDLASYNGTATLGLAGGSSILDLAGNTVTTSLAQAVETYDVRNIAPLMASITRLTPASAATNADQVVWRLTFAQIDGTFALPANAFTVTGTTGTVTDVSRFSIGFDVTVSGGDLAGLDGDVTLGLADTDFLDDYGNAMDRTIPAGAETAFTIDNTSPSLTISGPSDSVAGAFTANFTFNEDVTGFEQADIRVGNGTLSNFAATNAQNYTATITPTASGNVTVDVDGGDATDLAGNDNLLAPTLTIAADLVAPLVSSITRGSPSLVSTNANMLTWRVAFSESVQNVDASDFQVNGTTGTVSQVLVDDQNTSPPAGPDLAYALAPNPTLTGEAFLVTVSGGDLADLNANVTLGFAGGQNITDAAGNALADTTVQATNDNVFTVDNTAPVLSSFARNTPADQQTDADSLVFAISFDEVVTNVSADDFVITGTTATGVIGGSNASYTLTVSGGDLANLNGTVGLDLAAGQDIVDAAGNALPAGEPATDHTYSVLNDGVAPRVASIVRTVPSTPVTNWDSLVWAVTFSENVANLDALDFTVTGSTASVTDVSAVAIGLPPSVAGDGLSSLFAVSSSAFRVTISGGDLANLDGTVTLSFAGTQNITDEAGNALENTTPTGTDESSYTVDNTAPTVTMSSDATAPVTGAFAVTITFSEAVTGFEAGDIAVDNGSASGFQAVSATAYTVNIAPGTGATVRVDVAAGAAVDAAGNGNAAPDSFQMAHRTHRTLRLMLPGVGHGRVASASNDVSCESDCNNQFLIDTIVTLTATAADTSTFAGWTAGPCAGQSDPVCAVTMSADQTVSARFTLDNPPAGRIVASTLPGARSGYVGGPVLTAFLSVVSRTTTPAQSCRVTAPSGAPFSLSYSQLDAEGNVVGSADPMFDIAAGGALSFVLGMTPTAETSGYEYLPMVVCENADLDPIVGVNSISLTIGPAPTPDILSVAATVSGDGVIQIPGPGRTFFMTAAAVNIGVGDGTAGANEVTLTVSADTGAASLPVEIELCQIDATSACITPRGPTVTAVVAQNTPIYLAAFVRDVSTNGIAFDPANARVFIRFRDGNGVLRSSTSAAVTAPAPVGADVASALPSGRWSVLMRQPDGVWPGLQRVSVFVDRSGQILVANGDTVRRSRLVALRGGEEGQGRFALGDLEGVWTADGAIRLGAPWSEQQGEFWGVGDIRSAGDQTWQDHAGTFGDGVVLTETGELRGQIAGCAVYGTTSGQAGEPVAVTLSGCAASGDYLAVIDLPANDNELPALLVAGVDRGWRLTR